KEEKVVYVSDLRSAARQYSVVVEATLHRPSRKISRTTTRPTPTSSISVSQSRALSPKSRICGRCRGKSHKRIVLSSSRVSSVWPSGEKRARRPGRIDLCSRRVDVSQKSVTGPGESNKRWKRAGNHFGKGSCASRYDPPAA